MVTLSSHLPMTFLHGTDQTFPPPSTPQRGQVQPATFPSASSSGAWAQAAQAARDCRIPRFATQQDSFNGVHAGIIDVLFPLVGWLIEGFEETPEKQQVSMMIDGIPNRPLYFFIKRTSNWLGSLADLNRYNMPTSTFPWHELTQRWG